MEVKQIVCPTKLLHPEARVPLHGSARAAGFDIYCVGGREGLDETKWDAVQIRAWEQFGERGQVVLAPGQSFLFRTGFQQAIQEGYVCLFWDRSGMGGKRCIHRLAGVIDDDYRGEWFVRLVNLSNEDQTIKVGDKIVQGIYQERIAAVFPIVPAGDDLPSTARGDGGFGSTDNPQPVDEEDAEEDLGSEAMTDEEEEDADLAGAAADVAGREDPTQPPGEIRYDGIDVEKAIAALGSDQVETAARWIETDTHFFPDGIKVDRSSLRLVEGQNVVAFTALED